MNKFRCFVSSPLLLHSREVSSRIDSSLNSFKKKQIKLFFDIQKNSILRENLRQYSMPIRFLVVHLHPFSVFETNSREAKRISLSLSFFSSLYYYYYFVLSRKQIDKCKKYRKKRRKMNKAKQLNTRTEKEADNMRERERNVIYTHAEKNFDFRIEYEREITSLKRKIIFPCE